MAITSDVQELFDRYDMILSDKSIDNCFLSFNVPVSYDAGQHRADGKSLPDAIKIRLFCGNVPFCHYFAAFLSFSAFFPPTLVRNRYQNALARQMEE